MAFFVLKTFSMLQIGLRKLCKSDGFLDGELWVGRENFQEMGVVRRKNPDPKEWLNVKYVVYDMPMINKPFHKRIKELEKVVKKSEENWLKIRKIFQNHLIKLIVILYTRNSLRFQV